MSYSPPASGDVDFGVKSYDPPSSGSVVLDVTQNVVIQPDAIDLQLAVGDAFIAPEVVLVSPDAIDLQLSVVDDPFITAQQVVRPEPFELSFEIPLAGIQPFLYSNEWQIDQNRLSPSTDIETGPQSLSLSFEVGGDTIDTWRQYDRAGDITTESGFGGSFRALDRSDQGPVEVRSSFDDMRPFEPSLEYFVAGYSETQIAPDRYEITLELQRPRNRGRAFPAIAETGGEWVIETERSTLALSGGQVGTIDSDGSTTGPRRQLGLVVSDDQAAALIDDLGFPAGISTRAVPDGEDQLVDDNGSQSITLTAPPGADIDGGEWLVPEWSLSFQSFDGARRWQVALTLAR
jgi:hypothetical protein